MRFTSMTQSVLLLQFTWHGG